MFMDPYQMTLYPKFTRYVRESMPTCAKVDRIMSGLKMFGALDVVDATSALTWGRDPLVLVTDMWDEGAGKSMGNGAFDPSRPGMILMAETRVNQFEWIPHTGTRKNARGQDVYIVGSTLLHELCHWGMFRKGLPEKREAGKAFERYVYGKQID